MSRELVGIGEEYGSGMRLSIVGLVERSRDAVSVVIIGVQRVVLASSTAESCLGSSDWIR